MRNGATMTTETTTKPGVLRNAAVCENCRQTMLPGVEVRWTTVTRTRHRSYSGRAYDVARRVPVHTHDCLAELIELQRQQRLEETRAWCREQDAADAARGAA